MNISRGRILGLAVVGTALAGLVAAGSWLGPRADAKGSSGPTLRYQLVSLGTLGGPTSTAYGMNGYGDVVGGSDLANGGSAAFVWFNATGTIHNLNVFVDPAGGWTITEAHGINNDGQICGSAYKVPVSGGAAIRFEPPAAGALYGTLTFMSSNNSVGDAINDHGDVVGLDDDANNGIGGTFIYTDELGTHLVSGIEDTGLMSSISNREIATDPTSAYIAGSSFIGSAERAVRYTPGRGVIDLGSLNRNNSAGNAVNDSGQVTGWSNAGGGDRAFRYTDGSGMLNLGTSTVEGLGINNNGDVVGHGAVSGGAFTPFIYLNTFGAVDVRTLTTNIPVNTTGVSVRVINNGRDIAGQYNGVACILEVTHQ